jgi:hypothetical protein
LGRKKHSFGLRIISKVMMKRAVEYILHRGVYKGRSIRQNIKIKNTRMKIQPFTISIHALVWVLLLVIPYVSTDQVFNSIEWSKQGHFSPSFSQNRT